MVDDRSQKQDPVAHSKPRVIGRAPEAKTRKSKKRRVRVIIIRDERVERGRRYQAHHDS